MAPSGAAERKGRSGAWAERAGPDPTSSDATGLDYSHVLGKRRSCDLFPSRNLPPLGKTNAYACSSAASDPGDPHGIDANIFRFARFPRPRARDGMQLVF